MANKAEPVKVEASPKQQETKKSKGGFGKGLLVGCIVIFICLIICCFTTFFFFGSIFSLAFGQIDEINEQVLDDVCNASNSELRDVYNNHFTTRYKKDVSYTEFARFYNDNKDLFGACSDRLDKIDLQDFVEGFSFSYSYTNGDKVVDLSLTADGDKLSMRVVEDDDEWLIDELSVE